MKTSLLVALVIAMLCGCAEQKAKTAVKALLNDPDSAQFTEVQSGKNPGDVCGMVNAKNRMGGYVGATPFLYEKLTETAAIVKAPETSDFRMIWLGIKTDNFADDLTKVLMQCRMLDQWESTCKTAHPQGKHEMCGLIQGDPKAIYSGLKSAFDK